ncbi:MAG: hypothetical protein HDS25_01050 [Bacteroides sp.]|nr:hypothetical protein [Bacteroides sp.]MBD5294893.1 hypothetical protein [Bacteroides sp.]
MKHLKEEFDKLSFKEVLMYSMCFVCMTAAIVCIFLSMYMEPRGEIHASVLTYFGLSLGFCGSIFGISAHYSSNEATFKAQILQLVERLEASKGGPTPPTISVGA